MKKDIINILNKYYRFMICFLIALAFMKLFSLFKEPNYNDIINYGERGTILIGALAGLTFSYAGACEYMERKAIRKIGEHFLKSFLYFVIGLIFLIGFREPLFNPSRLSIFPEFLDILSLIIIFILFFTGFGMLIMSAYYLGVGIYELTKSLSKNTKYETKSLNNLQQLDYNKNFDEEKIESKDIRKIFENAMKKHDISFLDNFKDNSNLRYIQTLAELEISKIYSDVGIIFTLYGLGLTLFIVGSGNLANAPNYVLYFWFIAGIFIIIIAYSWSSLSRWRTEDRIDFLNDIILQVERKLP